MQNVNEKIVTGTSHERACSFIFTNRYNSIPTVTIQQEMLTALENGSVLAQPMQQLNAQFDNPAFPIALYDPETGEPTGQTILAEELHGILYSLWRHLRGE